MGQSREWRRIKAGKAAFATDETTRKRKSKDNGDGGIKERYLILGTIDTQVGRIRVYNSQTFSNAR